MRLQNCDLEGWPYVSGEIQVVIIRISYNLITQLRFLFIDPSS